MFRLLTIFSLLAVFAFAQYTNLDEIKELGGPQEFASRRATLCKAVSGKATILLFARIVLPESAHYR